MQSRVKDESRFVPDRDTLLYVELRKICLANVSSSSYEGGLSQPSETPKCAKSGTERVVQISLLTSTKYKKFERAWRVYIYMDSPNALRLQPCVCDTSNISNIRPTFHGELVPVSCDRSVYMGQGRFLETLSSHFDRRDGNTLQERNNLVF